MPAWQTITGKLLAKHIEHLAAFTQGSTSGKNWAMLACCSHTYGKRQKAKQQNEYGNTEYLLHSRTGYYTFKGAMLLVLPQTPPMAGATTVL